MNARYFAMGGPALSPAIICSANTPDDLAWAIARALGCDMRLAELPTIRKACEHARQQLMEHRQHGGLPHGVRYNQPIGEQGTGGALTVILTIQAIADTDLRS